jgi:hypothetical protein
MSHTGSTDISSASVGMAVPLEARASRPSRLVVPRSGNHFMHGGAIEDCPNHKHRLARQ